MENDWRVEALSGSLGAAVRGIDLRRVTAADVGAIRQLLLQHLVLFFPDQSLTPEAHVELGKHFGRLEGHPHLRNVGELPPEVFELRASHGGIADEWHSDVTFLEQPSILAILHMVQCPAVGGDTLWANMYRAYEALSPPMRELCEGLRALHDATPHGRPEKAAVHPVVRVHPETGRKSLFVNEHFTRRIVEVSHEESETLLAFLRRWIANPRFGVRYRWSAGTVAMWDNRCTQHFVLDDFEGERIIQRVTVMDDVPKAARAPRFEPYVRGRHPGATSRYDLALHAFLSRDDDGSGAS